VVFFEWFVRIEHNRTPSGTGPNQNETTETTLRIEDWLKEVDIALWSHCMCVCVKMAVEQSNLFGLFIVLSCIRFSFRSFSRSCAISSLGSVSHFARPIGTERRRDNKLPWCGTIRLIWQRTGTPENTFTHHGWQMSNEDGERTSPFSIVSLCDLNLAEFF
jgi:hypothetical protein